MQKEQFRRREQEAQGVLFGRDWATCSRCLRAVFAPLPIYEPFVCTDCQVEAQLPQFQPLVKGEQA